MLRFLRSISLTKWILIMMVIGAAIGHFAPATAIQLKPLSTMFLRMIKAIVVPIIFGSLVMGIAGHGDDMKRVGRLAFKSLIYFEILTTIALVVGLVAVNLTKPGVGVVLAVPAAADSVAAQQFVSSSPTLSSVLEHTVPQSFFEAASKNEVLQVVFFSILFAVGLSQVQGRPKEAMLGFCEGLAETMFKFTGLVMKFAPIGIGAAIAVTVGHSGIQVLKNLGLLVLTLYGALIVFVLVGFVPVALIARVPIRRFLTWVKEPALIAFSTTSSEAALPKAMENMEKLGVPRRIVAFVLPTGYSFNLDGSTLYLSLAAVFVAQAAGRHLSLGETLLMMATLMITSKGVAAVPRASLVILSGTLVSFGLPLEGVAVILGVDELMDMARTCVNLVGNCLASVVMARWRVSWAMALPEAWLRGPLPGIDPLLQPAAHALAQAGVDLEHAAHGLDAAQLWRRPGGAASVGFHLRHVAGSIDRLLTYARGEQLSPELLRAIPLEQAPGSRPAEAAQLVQEAQAAIARALDQLRNTPGGTLLQPRAVGRAGLPSTVLGVLGHLAEHTQHHTGQIITTAKIVRSTLAPVPALIDEIDQVMHGDPWYGAPIAGVLNGVTAEQAARRPIPGAHTIWELVLHLISWTREVTRRLDEGIARQPADGDWPAMPEPTEANWAAALADLSEAHAKLGQSLARVAEPRLVEQVGYERDAPLGSGVSYLAMLHGLLQHDTYHLGQIALLKKY